MKPTPIARGIAGAAFGLLVAGVLAQTATPGALGLALLLYLLHARFAADAAFRQTEVHLDRQVAERIVHEARPFHVRLDSSASRVPEGVQMRVHDRVPESVTALDAPEVEGAAVRTYAARATARGPQRFTGATVHLADGRGLWTVERAHALRTGVQVLPNPDAHTAGERLARRDPLEPTVPSLLGLIVREFEMEDVRPYAPGDRLRDVLWRRYAQRGVLISKKWEKDREATVLLVLDAGRTMRARPPGGESKVDRAARLAIELASAAVRQGHRVGYLAFDDLQALDEIPPARDAGFPQRLSERVANLPEQILVQRRLDAGMPGGARADEAELDFVESLLQLRGAQPERGGRVGVEAALRRALGHGGNGPLFLILLTDLETVPDRALRAVAQVTRRQHRVITVTLPGTRYLRPPTNPRLRDLENAYREHRTRRRARHILAREGAQLLELGPEDASARITRATQEAAPKPTGRGGR